MLSPLARWFVIATLSVIGVGVVVGAVVLWPSDTEHSIPMQFRSADGGSIQTVDDHVVDTQRADCLNPLTGTVQDSAEFQLPGASPTGPCIAATVQLDDGSLVTVWYEKLAKSSFGVLRQAQWTLS